jgi:hypothetical protein
MRFQRHSKTITNEASSTQTPAEIPRICLFKECLAVNSGEWVRYRPCRKMPCDHKGPNMDAATRVSGAALSAAASGLLSVGSTGGMEKPGQGWLRMSSTDCRDKGGHVQG